MSFSIKPPTPSRLLSHPLPPHASRLTVARASSKPPADTEDTDNLWIDIGAPIIRGRMDVPMGIIESWKKPKPNPIRDLREVDTADHVVIVGAGIAGLATALALQQRNVPAIVIESADSLRTEGAAIGVWTNGMKALEALGVAAEVRAAHPPLSRVQLCSADGHVLRSFGFDECDHGPHDFRGVRRLGLLQLLKSKLRPGSVFYGVTVQSVTTGPTPSFTVKCTATATGATFPALAIVGTDGIRSSIAASLGLPMASLAGYSAHRGIAVFPQGIPLPMDTIRQVWGRGVRAGLYPVGPNEVYWFTCFNEDPSQLAASGESSVKRTPEAIKAEALGLVEGWGLGVREAIMATPAEEITRGRIADRILLPKGVGQGAVTLAGDSLHPMTPNLGQGGCTALEDAVQLARAIASATSSAAVSDMAPLVSALRAYEEERLRRCLPITVRSRGMGIALQSDNAALCAARNTFVKYLYPPSHFLDHTAYQL